MKPLKHESCDMRNALTNPQSYCSELDSGNDIIGSRDIDGIHGIVAKFTRLGCWCERITGLILVVSIDDLCGFEDAIPHPDCQISRHCGQPTDK